jgi:hypothetical protein
MLSQAAAALAVDRRPSGSGSSDDSAEADLHPYPPPQNRKQPPYPRPDEMPARADSIAGQHLDRWRPGILKSIDLISADIPTRDLPNLPKPNHNGWKSLFPNSAESPRNPTSAKECIEAFITIASHHKTTTDAEHEAFNALCSTTVLRPDVREHLGYPGWLSIQNRFSTLKNDEPILQEIDDTEAELAHCGVRARLSDYVGPQTTGEENRAAAARAIRLADGRTTVKELIRLFYIVVRNAVSGLLR